MHYPTGDLLNSPRYGYQLTQRPAEPTTTPEGVGREFSADNLPGYAHNWSGTPFGHVSYAEPLTPAQIDHFSLIPITELAALNGQHYVESFLGSTFTHHVTRTEKGTLRVDSDCEGEKETSYYTYRQFLELQKEARWEPAPLPSVAA